MRADSPAAPVRVYRHRLFTRLWHWVNAVAVIVLIGSGLMIFNAHPRLYWGHYGANFDPAWLELPRWPGWVTLPSRYSLAGARHWHLAFALVLAFGLLAYMVWGLVNRHIQRDLRIRRRDLTPALLCTDLKAHWALRFHDPHDPRAYNGFQKLSYVGVVFVLMPLLVLSGLALAPGMWPWLSDLFGGRQSARSVHFIAMGAMTLFVVVHLTLVILAGPVNELRSMVTGWWRTPEEDHS
ncbi:cytochrome b/b6 domain-containing protein [Sphingomonas xinjiangensis]|uniref:Ni/Fe-hydrogenase b-type cytochrome subunit n=1 Tax=Sphingomonas xinjiangensis TaxID=643568 RepID=A0A840YFJ1_9SPHN|nr:cytochrome b/b6 domain-containing protein [Sphingomonas xinjiangensis]MBB5712217.1 Ni/Fe-hydrogenase b-type cytochrome subunit [Sphingomonas xinjiangensis]